LLLIYSFQFRSAFIPFMAARHRHCFRHRHIPELTSSFNSIDVRTDGRRLARDRLLDIRRYGRPLTKEYDTYHDPCWSLLSPLPRAAILAMATIAHVKMSVRQETVPCSVQYVICLTLVSLSACLRFFRC